MTWSTYCIIWEWLLSSGGTQRLRPTQWCQLRKYVFTIWFLSRLFCKTQEHVCITYSSMWMICSYISLPGTFIYTKLVNSNWSTIRKILNTLILLAIINNKAHTLKDFGDFQGKDYLEAVCKWACQREV